MPNKNGPKNENPAQDVFFDALVRDTSKEISRYAFQSIAHWTAAVINTEDLVQETYVRFFEALTNRPLTIAHLTTREAIVRYLKGIVDFCVREIVRSAQAQKNAAFVSPFPEDWQDTADLGSIDPEENASWKEWISASLERLNPRSHEILLLSVQGVPLQDIAQKLSVSVEAVRSDLYRTKKTLRKWIKEDEDGHGKLSDQQFEFLKQDAHIADARLSASQRIILQMRLIESKSYKEISLALEKSVGAVKTQFYRACKILAAEPELFWTNMRLKQLPIKTRKTVEMRFSAHLTYAAMAKHLKRSESAIRTEISRAKNTVLLGRPAAIERQMPHKNGRRHELPSDLHYELLKRVSPTFRTVMMEFYSKTNPLSIKEIVQKLREDQNHPREISESTVKAYLKRGRDQLNDIVVRAGYQHCG